MMKNLAPELPADILYLICDELLEKRDFGSLFSCASASKSLAVPALTSLYRAQRMSDLAKTEDVFSSDHQNQLVQKWSVLWRSIILSALGKTIMPYCKYIRVLDLNNLQQLLDEDRFRNEISTNFFSKDLARFNITVKKKPRGRRLDLIPILEAIGDLLTSESPLLESVLGPISGDALARWIPRLPNLLGIQVWDGKSLGDDRLASLLRKHCPKFEALALYGWVNTNWDTSLGVDPECDKQLGAIFSGLPEHTLRSFDAFSRINFGAESALALSTHGRSLLHLELQVDNNALPHLGLLKECNALEYTKLTISDRDVDLERTQHDVFLDVVAWLSNCRNLHTLILSGAISGGAIVTPVLLVPQIHLQTLEVDNYAVKDHTSLHMALAQQPTLERLFLDSDAIESRDGLDILAHSVCQLKQLQYLKLVGVSAMFSDVHVRALSGQLEYLEDLYVGGLQLTDASLESVVHLRNLRSLAFSEMSVFTFDGLSNFITKLGAGNRGLVLAIDSADPLDDSALSEAAQKALRDELAAKVDGRLEYTFWRDPDISEFEGDESD